MLSPEERTSDYVCASCGIKFLTDKQKEESSPTTFSVSECGLCGEKTSTTHIRKYNYLQKMK